MYYLLYPDIIFLWNMSINILVIYFISRMVSSQSIITCIIEAFILSTISTLTYIFLFNINTLFFNIIYSTLYIFMICLFFRITKIKKIITYSLICFYLSSLLYGIFSLSEFEMSYLKYIKILLCFFIFIILLNQTKTLFSSSSIIKNVHISLPDQQLNTSALIDTGNMLTMPVTNKPVIILDPCIFSKNQLLYEIVNEYKSTGYFNYELAAKRLNILFYPLPYQTISGSNTIMPVFKIKRIIIPKNNTILKNVYGGISKNCLSNNHIYKILIGQNVLAHKEDYSND